MVRVLYRPISTDGVGGDFLSLVWARGVEIQLMGRERLFHGHNVRQSNFDFTFALQLQFFLFLYKCAAYNVIVVVYVTFAASSTPFSTLYHIFVHAIFADFTVFSLHSVIFPFCFLFLNVIKSVFRLFCF